MANSPLRFSFIIPAHNEEKYLSDTLTHVAALEYPKGCYEAIVIENGSTDRTWEIAERFEGETIHVLQNTSPGVSAAKNLGIARLSPMSDWVIFLDADVILEPSFLRELDAFLRVPNHFTVGTTAVRPLPDTLKARAWFKFYDLGHRLTKSSFSIKLVKRSLFPALRFDEALSMGEDLLMIKQALDYGNFFFMPTRSVHTSTRRFEKEGWWKIFWFWNFVAILPVALQRRFKYKIVR